LQLVQTLSSFAGSICFPYPNTYRLHISIFHYKKTLWPDFLAFKVSQTVLCLKRPPVERADCPVGLEVDCLAGSVVDCLVGLEEVDCLAGLVVDCLVGLEAVYPAASLAGSVALLEALGV
jgi:hypothetical protein